MSPNMSLSPLANILLSVPPIALNLPLTDSNLSLEAEAALRSAVALCAATLLGTTSPLNKPCIPIPKPLNPACCLSDIPKSCLGMSAGEMAFSPISRVTFLMASGVTPDARAFSLNPDITSLSDAV